MDQKVLDAQKWVNATYSGRPGYVSCAETGNTGWSTMYSLTRALQIELGITTPSDSFGPTTLSKLTALGNVGPGLANNNIIKIAQHGLFCKGYWGGNSIGMYDSTTTASVQTMKYDMGLTGQDGLIQPKIFKAILCMDAYIILSPGTTEVRKIQQWLNQRYIGKSTFYVGPCDGIYSRDVQQALMKGIQYELGIAEDQVNGNFGPSTQSGLRAHTVSSGSPQIWVQLYSAACVFNGTVDSTSTVFKTTWDTALASYTKTFQKFSQLTQSGIGDYQTWAQLLVSTGDPDRPAGACDTRFHISVARAQALKAAGYKVVGRYLDEDATSTLDKEIQPGELDAIFTGGMRVFPISQYNGRGLADFTYTTGYQHALKAHARAVGYGFNRGTTIYFAVDYDATDEQITSNIVPYFNGVQAGLANQGKRYLAGVYGSRNVCIRASSETNTLYSFVSGMSYGFSGNLGFPMPSNWSFNQIKEFSFTSGTDTFDLDRDVQRAGSDPGVGRENVNGTASPVAAYLTYIDALYACAVRYNKGNPSQRVMEYLRYPKYVTVYQGWGILIGGVDEDWITYANANGPTRVMTYKDPTFGIEINADHFGATANAVYLKGSGTGSTPGGTGDNAWRGDFGGWGGDLSTFYGEWRNNDTSYASGLAFCNDRLAKLNVQSSFGLGDMVEDADGYLIGTAVRGGARIDQALRTHLTSTGADGYLKRFTRYVNGRFGGTGTAAVATARTMLLDVGWDDTLDAIRTQAIRSVSGVNTMLPGYMPSYKLDPFLQGFADCLLRLKGQE